MNGLNRAQVLNYDNHLTVWKEIKERVLASR
jgi:hypothetical protein